MSSCAFLKCPPDHSTPRDEVRQDDASLVPDLTPHEETSQDPPSNIPDHASPRDEASQDVASCISNDPTHGKSKLQLLIPAGNFSLPKQNQHSLIAQTPSTIKGYRMFSCSSDLIIINMIEGNTFPCGIFHKYKKISHSPH